MRVKVLSLTLMLVAGATALAPPIAQAADVPGPGVHHYVALGDSFTAGPFIPGWASVDCARSNNNYPTTLAVKLGLYYENDRFTDVSCSAADTTSMEGDFTTVLGTNRGPQLDAIRPDTDLVTLGIGGNDETFFGTFVDTCADLQNDDLTGSPCQQANTVNGVDQLAMILPRTKARVARVIQAIKERAPGARIVVVGYLRVLPADLTPCVDVPLSPGDIEWFDGLERQLNGVLSSAASENGVTFVDTYGPGLGHDACAGDDAWAQGVYTDVFEAGAWHPLKAGMDAVAQLVYDKLNGIDLAAGHLVTASSTESGYAPSKALDRDPYTRWASYYWRDNEWLKVDLGSKRTIRRLELNWEYAYARGYRIEVSTDGSTWRTVWSTINADGGHDTVRFVPTAARYVRLVGAKRGTRYGISLYDLEVYNS
ncbi:GDSL-type esterase/lipase family protein [Nocardioides humilatus]|uniref:GDSL-type esterase/lipase family protein n=1 Tax=Nocardioides humilatus TaxID=2607660 RepID=UPI00165EF9A9|nr:GDSL-type esterase/lipase family protein [Nocardioides humilatus]